MEIHNEDQQGSFLLVFEDYNFSFPEKGSQLGE